VRATWEYPTGDVPDVDEWLAAARVLPTSG